MVFTHIVKDRYTLIEQSPRLARFNSHAIAYLLGIFIWVSKCTFLQHMTIQLAITISTKYMAIIAILLAIYIDTYIQRPSTYHSCDKYSIHVQLCMIFCLLLYMKLWCLLSASTREGFFISSVECPRELYMQYNLCIIDTLGLFISVQIIRVYRCT